jgi:hypothetical protein
MDDRGRLNRGATYRESRITGLDEPLTPTVGRSSDASSLTSTATCRDGRSYS